MKLIRALLLFAALILVALVAFNIYANGSWHLSQESKTNFEWFSGLGFPDVKGCSFVRVATGDWGRMGDQPPQNGYVKAFLLTKNSTSFTTLSLDLFKRTLPYSTNGTPEFK